jgi:hypothetical protein
MLLRPCLSAALLILLAACTRPDPVPPTNFADLRFTGERPIRIAVGRIELIDRFQPSFKAPEIEYEFPVPPARALANLCRDRFQATTPGSPSTLRFTIMDASVRESELPRSEGLQATFTIDQAQRYDGHIAVRVELIDDNGIIARTAEAEDRRSWTVAEDITPDEREDSWYEQTQAMVTALDRELERQIDARFSPYQS